MTVEEYGADIINDVAGPVKQQTSPYDLQKSMFRMVSRLGVPYIYMSRKATMKDILLDCAEVVDTLRSMGQKDIVLDPGFGFGKTLEQNYAVMQELERMQMLHLPLLVGISRKSMIYRLLGITPEASLNGTTVINTLALTKGASILRVHDVKEAVEVVNIYKQCFSNLE
jgi:dihydropteroate synthase